MKLANFILATILITSVTDLSAAKPEKLPMKPEKIERINTIKEQCIDPFQEQHDALKEEKNSEFDLIKASYRSGEISEADLELQLQETALIIEAELASLEAKKEICEVQFGEVEEIKEAEEPTAE